MLPNFAPSYKYAGSVAFDRMSSFSFIYFTTVLVNWALISIHDITNSKRSLVNMSHYVPMDDCNSHIYNFSNTDGVKFPRTHHEAKLAILLKATPTGPTLLAHLNASGVSVQHSFQSRPPQGTSNETLLRCNGQCFCCKTLDTKMMSQK